MFVSDSGRAGCWRAGPSATTDALLDRADRVLAELPDAELDAALDGHPRIGARSEDPNSAREQARVADANAAVKAELAAENRSYEDTFGYVYLVCASGRTAEELLDILTDRLANDPDTERRVMRSELAKINRLRLERLLSKETVMSSLSTHVLDAVSGRPAVGVPVTLTDASATVLATSVTDDDGRIIALGGDLGAGLLPAAVRHRHATSPPTVVTAFYPEVVIAFEVTDAPHYHVPLLLSPFAYSTYRGS